MPQAKGEDYSLEGEVYQGKDYCQSVVTQTDLWSGKVDWYSYDFPSVSTSSFVEIKWMEVASAFIQL
jgi:hypothetical protein